MPLVFKVGGHDASHSLQSSVFNECSEPRRTTNCRPAVSGSNVMRSLLHRCRGCSASLGRRFTTPELGEKLRKQKSAVAPTNADQKGARGAGQGRDVAGLSGERSERTLDAPKRSRKMLNRSDGLWSALRGMSRHESASGVSC